ncbi:c-type cytochrome [Hydrogenimonas sp.]|uniref:c-type cytochrome n=1 Tax=Hydrogenimonas sp. TaxID=2231112 RepID=UPI00261DB424|nr:c-type cytochrome [Hydrogenimonas sp.]
MRQLLVLLTIVVFVAIAFYVNQSRHRSTTLHHHASEKEAAECLTCREREAERTIEELRSVAYLEQYVEDVINHGSSQKLGFAYGDMPANMADEKAAPKIAAYVATLAGRKPTHPEWVKEGHTFYVSNCGGCHGEDGKGVHGTFPDLTRNPMLGIEHRIRKATKR